jgi:hypothetical protein
MKFLLLLLLTIPAFAQSDLPDRGDIADIKGKTKVYVAADGEHYDAITKALAKHFTLSPKAADADFFLAYESLSRDVVGPSRMHLEKGQLTAYYYRDKTKVIAWSDHRVGGGFKADTSKELVKRFLKAFTK